jgi:hypothetical protein
MRIDSLYMYIVTNTLASAHTYLCVCVCVLRNSLVYSLDRVPSIFLHLFYRHLAHNSRARAHEGLGLDFRFSFMFSAYL